MELSGQLHAPAALPPGKEPQVPSGRRLGGPRICSIFILTGKNGVCLLLQKNSDAQIKKLTVSLLSFRWCKKFWEELHAWLPWITDIYVKVKVFMCLTKRRHAMKTCWGSGGIAPCIINLVARWRWVVSFTPRRLYPRGENRRYPLVRRLGGPQSQFGRGGKEKNFQPLPGIEPRSSST
jgi:hypothetical protein